MDGVEKIDLDHVDWKSSREFFESLGEALDKLDDKDESYNFTWVGKRKSIIEAGAPINKTLRPDVEASKDFDNTKNMLIVGDNLDALKLLQESYLGKIKMIYIDPPYNTGSDFIYHDNFTIKKNEYIDGSINSDGISVISEDEFIENSKANGRFHSDWLNMIYPRLKLAKNLLTDDGVIAISIDDDELYNLKKVLDEIFGEENFLNTIAIKMSTASGVKLSHRDRNILKTKEYLVLYAKRKDLLTINPQYTKKKEWDNYYEWFLEKNGDDIKDWKVYKLQDYVKKKLGIETLDINNEEFRNFYFEHSDCIWQRGRNTSIPKDVLAKSNENWDTIFEYSGEDGKPQYCYKGRRMAFLSNVMKDCINSDCSLSRDMGTLICDFWDHISTAALFSEGGVDFPNGKKPQLLLNTVLRLFVNNDDIILDFFAGSGSTGEAVMRLNALEGRTNKYILVQLPEEANKNNTKEKDFKTIDELTAERLRRSGEKLKNEYTKTNFDSGFRILRIDDSNFEDSIRKPLSEISQSNLFETIDNVKKGRTPLDLLFGVVYVSALPFDLKLETRKIGENTVYLYGYLDEGTGLVACFDDTIPEETIKEIASLKALTVAFKDSSFADSAAKINLSEHFRMLSPDTKVKVI